MTTNKFVTIINGIRTLVTAISASTGASDANKIISTGSSGTIDPSFMPVGVGFDVETIVASEALTAGNFVNIYDNAGTRNCRKADASNGRVAHGFVLTGVASAGSATVYCDGTNTSLTGLTAGLTYKLSAATAGGTVVSSTSFTTGQIDQILGVAVSSTAIEFKSDPGGVITIG